MMHGKHYLAAKLLDKRIEVAVAGVGGNGGHVLQCLARLDIAMRELGHPHGLHVCAYDPDTVSQANIGRQLFLPSDVGEYKALVGVERINLAFGFDWIGYPERYQGQRECDLLISCVDTRAARAEFHQLCATRRGPKHYWLDMGNEDTFGNCVLGEVAQTRKPQALRLPLVTELFPELLDKRRPEINTHSCSLRISLQSQGLFINDITARVAMQLLYRLLSEGHLTAHGALINLETMRVAPIAVDPRAWARFGWREGGIGA
jgi:PRTRC genetic system ThiF family protein